MSHRAQRYCCGARRARAARRQNPADFCNGRSKAGHASNSRRLRQGVRSAHPWSLRLAPRDRERRQVIPRVLQDPITGGRRVRGRPQRFHLSCQSAWPGRAVAPRRFSRSSDGGGAAASGAMRVIAGALACSSSGWSPGPPSPDCMLTRRRRRADISPTPTILRQSCSEKSSTCPTAPPVTGETCKVSRCGRLSINMSADGRPHMTRPDILGCIPTKKFSISRNTAGLRRRRPRLSPTCQPSRGYWRIGRSSRLSPSSRLAGRSACAFRKRC